jgi:hypothetical protein
MKCGKQINFIKRFILAHGAGDARLKEHIQ